MSRFTLTHFQKMKTKREKIVCLTAYDASFGQLVEEAGVEIVLIGDSLGMVIQGHDSTLPVTLDDMVYHCRLVHRGTKRAFLIVDMPFMSYATPQAALESSAKLMREGQAQMVKLEGGSWLEETVQLLTDRGIPVCGHLGLTPQSVHQLGGYRVRGRVGSEAEHLRRDAIALQAAGASLLILECVPSDLTEQIAQELTIPVIGIGAGVKCDGQILVLYDMLGITPKSPSFAKNFLLETGSIQDAVTHYVNAVKAENYPSDKHSFF